MNRPLRLRNVRCYCLCTTNVYSTCTQYLSQHHAADCPRTPTFTHVHPLWCVIAFIQFGADGRDESAPTPTECALRLFTYTNIYPRTPMFTPRAPTVGADLSCPHISECMLQLFMRNQCLFHEYMIFFLVHPLWYGGVICIIRADGHDKSTPTPTECTLRIVHVHQHLPTYTNVYTTCIHCRGRFIVPAYYGIHAADCPRTPTFTHVHPL